MTNEELDTMKYKVCCPMCDNYKCARGTDKCEAELWKKWRMRQMANEEYADKLRNKALSDYERLGSAINELERQMTPRKNHETTTKDCINREELEGET